MKEHEKIEKKFVCEVCAKEFHFKVCLEYSFSSFFFSPHYYTLSLSHSQIHTQAHLDTHTHTHTHSHTPVLSHAYCFFFCFFFLFAN